LQHKPFFGKFQPNSANIVVDMVSPLEQRDQEDEVITQEPAKVILFNDDIHTFEEVIVQVMKAIRCTQTRAEAIVSEAHNSGKAIVYAGEMLKCMEVSGILEEIKLMTQIEV
jgi:ATP-dependent Clp protease adapter protein ClpS